MLVFLLFAVPGAMADELDESTDQAQPSQKESDTSEQRATQRLDFGIDFYDASDGSIVRGGIDYNWAPHANHSFAATLPIVNSRLAEVNGSGIGDLLLRYNWVPSLTLTADPWVPNSLGIGLGLLVPTSRVLGARIMKTSPGPVKRGLAARRRRPTPPPGLLATRTATR